jgi:serine/threonine-protein kinase
VGTPQTPQIIGRYALYGRIAAGGMATVHYGRLLGPVGFSRTVAIKRLHAQFTQDPEFVSMFLDEARIAARIRHPNVVPTLDVVATDGELFLVMEYVQGESLARLVQESNKGGRRIPPEIAVAIVTGVLHGLHAAHESKNERGEPAGLVHRDISPQNVLVGADGVPRVLDFGVAKAMGRLQSTREGQIKGKLAYMAPEQIRASATRASDIYAAGVVLWEALTGKRLFEGENEAVVYTKIFEEKIQPPSAYAEGISFELDAIVMRSLERDPQKRFPTARDMARALQQAMPLVATSDLGEWVEHVAKKSLASRADVVAKIEISASGARVPPLPSSGRLGEAREASQPAAAPAEGSLPSDVTVASQLSSISMEMARARPLGTLLGKRGAILAGAVAVGLLFFVVFFAARLGSRSSGTMASGSPPAPTPLQSAGEPLAPPPKVPSEPQPLTASTPALVASTPPPRAPWIHVPAPSPSPTPSPRAKEVSPQTSRPVPKAPTTEKTAPALQPQPTAAPPTRVPQHAPNPRDQL